MQSETKKIYFEEFNQTVGSILRRQRLSRKVNPSQVEEALNLSATELKKIEQGTTSPAGCLFYRLIMLYGGSRFDVETQLFVASFKLREKLNSLSKK